MALIFDKLNIDTNEVLKAAETKWNFLPFKPGLVGGHCIGVDPYYLTHKAIEVGYHPEIILAGRRINDGMGDFIAEKTISELVKSGISPLGASITIFGLSFKEDCPDLRNTKVISVIKRLKQYNCKINVTDPYVIPKEAVDRYGIELQEIGEIKNQDAIVIAVAHREYKNLSMKYWEKLLNKRGVVIDIKSIYKKEFFDKIAINYWGL